MPRTATPQRIRAGGRGVLALGALLLLLSCRQEPGRGPAAAAAPVPQKEAQVVQPPGNTADAGALTAALARDVAQRVGVPGQLLKRARCLYTPQQVEAMRRLAGQPWAAQEVNQLKAIATPFLEVSYDQLWGIVTGQTLPRSSYVEHEGLGCPKCGKAAFEKAYRPFRGHVFKDRWKVTCPACGEVFPKNDFAAFYASGLDEHGVFDPKKADRTQLFNTEHPGPDDPLHGYGVDDGTGWVDKDGVHWTFIAYYNYWIVWEALIGDRGAIPALARLYLLTDEPEYARRCAILLDRIADIYPAMDFYAWAKTGHYTSATYARGKISDHIWETFIARRLIEAYDAVFPLLQANDPALIEFLSRLAATHGLENPKDNGAAIAVNIERGICREAILGVLNGIIHGNPGFKQWTVATVAAVLQDQDLRDRLIAWLMAKDPGFELGKPCLGGDMQYLLLTFMDRDGFGAEGALGYSSICPDNLRPVADMLDRAAGNAFDAVHAYQGLRRYYLTRMHVQLTSEFGPSFGDSGRCGDPGRAVHGQLLDGYAWAFCTYGDPEFAQALWEIAKRKKENLRVPLETPDAEALIERVAGLADKQGAFDPGNSALGGLGLGVFRSAYGTPDERALWMYFGRNLGHGHADRLNLGLVACGMKLAPDLGYPAYASSNPERMCWTGNTISHNTVVVDGTMQLESYAGRMRLFHGAAPARVMEVESPHVYRQCELYARTLMWIDAGPHSYAVDVFRVRGGSDHVLSFHGPHGPASLAGIAMTPQDGGTYAGHDVALGQFYEKDWTRPSGNTVRYIYGGSGFQWLDKVERGDAKAATLLMEWEAKDMYEKALPGTRLRCHVPCFEGEVATATGYPPANQFKNPPDLRYLLLRRRAPGGSAAEAPPAAALASRFVMVLEPYAGAAFLKSVELVAVEPEDDPVRSAAVRVTHVDGTVDYVYSCFEEGRRVRIGPDIEVEARFAFLRLRATGEPASAEVVAGTTLLYRGDGIRAERGAIRTRIADLTDRPSERNVIRVCDPLPADGSLDGQYLQVMDSTARARIFENPCKTGGYPYTILSEAERNPFYRICRVEPDRTIDLGTVSLVRGAKPSGGAAPEYVLDVNRGDEVIVPLVHRREWTK